MTIITPSIEWDGYSDKPWTVFASDCDPDVLGRFESGDDVRSFLYDHSRFAEEDEILLRDADGNGSDCVIPISWVGDGKRLVASRRVADLIVSRMA